MNVLSASVSPFKARLLWPLVVIIVAASGCSPPPSTSPIADAGADQTVGVGDTVTLDGGGSTVPNNTASSYAWTLTALPSGSTASLSSISGATTSFVADIEGDYTAELRIIAGGQSDTDAVTVHAGSAVQGNEDSPGQLALLDLDETGFVPIDSTLQFEVSGATLNSNPDALVVIVNGISLPGNSLVFDETTITVPNMLQEGLNHIHVVASDSEGRALYHELRLWAGNHTLDVDLVGQDGLPVSGSSVHVALSDDLDVAGQATSAGGQASFENLPDRTIIVTARATGNRLGTVATTGGVGQVEVVLLDINAPSPVNNNDFSLGTDGWEVDADGDGVAPVTVGSHVETSAASGGASTLSTLPAPRVKSTHAEAQAGPMSASLAPQQADMDLTLGTSGEGPQTISRTFVIEPGTKNITVRYQFITSEVPGGYYGTEYNDSFTVSIRSEQGGGSVSESNSMNGLGLGAFDAAGATAWRESDLTLDEEGDTVQVDITVANVADDKLDSQIVVDFVDEKALAITQLELNDMDNQALQFLSVGQHNYYGGNTRIHGTITVEGAQDDTLEELVLELLEGGAVVATANLAQDAQGTLLTEFGEDEMVEITDSQLLFELPAAQSGNVDQTNNGQITLRARARNQDGGEATLEYGAVDKLVRYTGNNRDGGRDTGNCIGVVPASPCGGDDWVKPSVASIVDEFVGVNWNDFSNMNGGNFPPHQTHRTGNDIDGEFANYAARNAQTAQTIVDFLNDDTIGPRVVFVYVTYQQAENNPFWVAIRNVVLDDGRQARDVIQSRVDHEDHFHVRISD